MQEAKTGSSVVYLYYSGTIPMRGSEDWRCKREERGEREREPKTRSCLCSSHYDQELLLFLLSLNRFVFRPSVLLVRLSSRWPSWNEMMMMAIIILPWTQKVLSAGDRITDGTEQINTQSSEFWAFPLSLWYRMKIFLTEQFFPPKDHEEASEHVNLNLQVSRDFADFLSMNSGLDCRRSYDARAMWWQSEEDGDEMVAEQFERETQTDKLAVLIRVVESLSSSVFFHSFFHSFGSFSPFLLFIIVVHNIVCPIHRIMNECDDDDHHIVISWYKQKGKMMKKKSHRRSYCIVSKDQDCSHSLSSLSRSPFCLSSSSSSTLYYVLHSLSVLSWFRSPPLSRILWKLADWWMKTMQQQPDVSKGRLRRLFLIRFAFNILLFVLSLSLLLLFSIEE